MKKDVSILSITQKLDYNSNTHGTLERFDYLIEDIIFSYIKGKQLNEFKKFFKNVKSQNLRWPALRNDNEFDKFSSIFLETFQKSEVKLDKILKLFNQILDYKNTNKLSVNLSLEYLRGMEIENIKTILKNMPFIVNKQINQLLAYYFLSEVIIDTEIELVLRRLGLIPRTITTKSDLRKYVKNNLPAFYNQDTFYKLKIHANSVCKSMNPLCNFCSLYDICEYEKKNEKLWIYEDLRESDFKVIELFSGAGGIVEGFSSTGFKPLLAVDFLESACKTLKENHPKTLVLCDDITNLEGEDLDKLLNGKKPDVIVGGPPCQGFSIAGRQDPNDPRNSLFMDFIRLLDYFQPPYFLMENVPGLLSAKNAKGEPVIDIIIKEFERIGYKVKKPVKLNAADYGVPQARRRVFIAGTNLANSLKFPPPPTHNEFPEKFSPSLDKWMNTDKQPIKLEKWVPVKSVLEKKKDVPLGYFHTPRMIEGFKKRKERNTKLGKGYGWQTLDPNLPSYTISARYWKDGSEALVKYNDKEIRMLTERECARIQTFPDSYMFLGKKSEIYTQIGNAVPCLLAKKLAESFKSALLTIVV